MTALKQSVNAHTPGAGQDAPRARMAQDALVPTCQGGTKNVNCGGTGGMQAGAVEDPL